MATVVMAPERHARPLNGNKLNGDHRKGQQPSARALSCQLACVAILVLTDLLTVAFALELAIFVRTHFVPHVDARLQPLTFPFSHYMVFGWLWLLLVLFLGVEGLYTRRRSIWNEVGHLTKAVGLGLVAFLAAVALAHLSLVISRVTIVIMAVNLLVLLPIVRYWTKRGLGAVGLWRKRILILGLTDMAELAMRGLTNDPFLGYEIAGLLDDDPAKQGSFVGICKRTPVYVLGKLSDTRAVMERTHCRDLLIAMPGLLEEKLLALVHELQPHCDSLYVVPQLWGLPMMNLQVDGFLRERVMMLKLSNSLAKPWNSGCKRVVDLVLGAAITLLVLPLCALLAILVKLDSEGPALFVQERLGYRGGRFRCLKFRTMNVNGEETLAQYLECNPHAADEWQRYAKLRHHDPRLTPLGRFLRRWSLDEFPQLLNVLKGEMSLVGPRPYLPQERARIGDDLQTILSARPGMTGFWQVSGRNHLTLEDRVQLEAWYVRNWSVWLDCIVLAKTFRTILLPENGRPSDEAVGLNSPVHRFSTTRVSSSAYSPESKDLQPSERV
jgi:Undecaprenyl-phosphate galactose phosphotransferase WbaP